MMEPLEDPQSWRDSVILKLLGVGALILILLIPLAMVGLLVGERRGRHDQVAAELAATWGGGQTLGGPLLSVPYRIHRKDEKGRPVEQKGMAHFLPKSLRIAGTIQPERRSRGIFEVVLYRADLRIAGTFARPDFASLRVAAADVLWDEAELTFGVTDMRGIRRRVRLRWGERELPFGPGGARPGLWDSGLRTPAPGLAPEAGMAGPGGRSLPFALDLALAGSGALHFLPAGETTVVALRSPWPDPSFAGAYLPERRSVGPRGFAAVWNVPFFGRDYPQAWRDAEAEDVLRRAAASSASAFGVDLYLPVDGYQKTIRAIKYGVLFLLLTFGTFFLFEVFHPFSVHPLQYLLVGSALCLFYLLLLSLSEHLPFVAAYATAAAATVALIAGYSAAVLHGRGRAAAMGGVLAGLYGYLYVLLQAEDYALLLGAAGLFVLLALVMYATRRVDWYAPRRGGSGMPQAGPP